MKERECEYFIIDPSINKNGIPILSSNSWWHCYREQNGKAKIRKDFVYPETNKPAWLCDHHYEKVKIHD